MTGVWIAVGTLATVGLLALGLWQLHTGRREKREVAERRMREDEHRERVISLEEQRERRATSSQLTVRPLSGFSGSEHRVGIQAKVTNSGGAHAHDVAVQAHVGNQIAASSVPCDIPPGESGIVDLEIPRAFVVSLQGQGVAYTDAFRLTVSDASGQSAEWIPGA